MSMPKFIDHHEMGAVAPELAEGIASRIEAGEVDEHGVKGLNVFLGKDGTAYCLSEAPDANAVVKAHEAYGFALSRADVVEVESVV
jgi:Nickel responsive protein SCO4226-like